MRSTDPNVRSLAFPCDQDESKNAEFKYFTQRLAIGAASKNVFMRWIFAFPHFGPWNFLLIPFLFLSSFRPVIFLSNDNGSSSSTSHGSSSIIFLLSTKHVFPHKNFPKRSTVTLVSCYGFSRKRKMQFALTILTITFHYYSHASKLYLHTHHFGFSCFVCPYLHAQWTSSFCTLFVAFCFVTSLRLQRLLHNVVSHAFIFVLSETSFESRPPSNHLYKAPRERHLPSGACFPPWTVNHLRLRPPSLLWEWRGRTDSLSSPVSVCGARATVWRTWLVFICDYVSLQEVVFVRPSVPCYFRRTNMVEYGPAVLIFINMTFSLISDSEAHPREPFTALCFHSETHELGNLMPFLCFRMYGVVHRIIYSSLVLSFRRNKPRWRWYKFRQTSMTRIWREINGRVVPNQMPSWKKRITRKGE